ncbi:MAG: hypothetical protein N2561_01335 [Bacteroidetes bacterium]|nr:hypothetical protein [Rhodothermia bacterium]MCX7906166.1 hypothetical protein [Bacteroidota bacterium]MDW8285978.1 hypothetical protein [Bacteroidota bacterium]
MIRLCRIWVEACGPLQGLSWSPGPVALIYDRNEEGKTALVEAITWALFPRPEQVFGADAGRFADIRAEAEVEVRGKRYRFRADRGEHLLRLLGWTQPQLARLFVVRSGQLELTREDRDRTPLMRELLRHALGPMARIGQLRDRLIKRAGLTPGLEWSDQRATPYRSRVQELEARLRTWEGLIGKLAELEAAERAAEQLRDRLRQLRQEREELLGRLRELEGLRRRRIAQQAWALYRSYRLLCQELEAFARYRFEDSARWAQLEAQGETWRKLEELAESYRDQRIRISAQEPLWRAREAELEARARSIEELERGRQESLIRLQAEIGPWQRAWEAAKRRQARTAWLAAVAAAAALAGVLLLVSPPLSGTPWPGLLLLLCGLGAGLYRVRLEVELRKLEAQRRLYRAELEHLFAFESPLEDLPKALEVVQARLREDLAARRADLEAERAQLRAEREQQQAAMRELERSLRTWLSDWDPATQDPVERVRALRRTVEAELGRLRERTGVAERQALEEKLRERQSLERRLQQLVGSWQTLTQTPIEKAESWLVEHPEPQQADELPSGPELEAAQARLQRALQEAEVRLQELEAALQEAERRLEQLKLPFYEKGLRSPAELYVRWQEDREALLELVELRLAATWAACVLEGLERDQRGLIDQLLRAGGEHAAVRIFCALNERYVDVRYEPDAERFVALRADGLAVPEAQLSDGARKQLLFALRVAFLRQLLKQEPAFLILDDPFITYDDEGRKERAVRWLGRMVQEGWQLLYFTTDRTTRELFASHLGVEPLRIEQLQRFSSVGP